jgi:hypothetical protein
MRIFGHPWHHFMAFMVNYRGKTRLALILLHGADMNLKRIPRISRGALSASLWLRNGREKFRIGVTDDRYVLVTEEDGA